MGRRKIGSDFLIACLTDIIIFLKKMRVICFSPHRMWKMSKKGNQVSYKTNRQSVSMCGRDDSCCRLTISLNPTATSILVSCFPTPHLLSASFFLLLLRAAIPLQRHESLTATHSIFAAEPRLLLRGSVCVCSGLPLLFFPVTAASLLTPCDMPLRQQR